MDADGVLVRTEKGAEEIETRKHKLDQKLRVLLITVNGKSTARELAAKFAQLGDVRPQLQSLVEHGYIREAPARRDDAGAFRRARHELAAYVVAALGPGGDPIAERIESCATFDELRAYLEGKREALGAALGSRAPQFFHRAASLLIT